VATDESLAHECRLLKIIGAIKFVSCYETFMGQLAMKFRTWGGKRKGAGRPQVNARKSEPHRMRTPINWNKPVHVSLRVVKQVGRLRRMDCYAILRKCLVLLLERSDFRVIHISIQSNHIHLIVEAASATALARGLQSFEISAARKLNAELGRKGTVFPDRYHATVITSRPPPSSRAGAARAMRWRTFSTTGVATAKI
jgi:REP element-mobilizing transposase RayT